VAVFHAVFFSAVSLSVTVQWSVIFTLLEKPLLWHTAGQPTGRSKALLTKCAAANKEPLKKR